MRLTPEQEELIHQFYVELQNTIGEILMEQFRGQPISRTMIEQVQIELNRVTRGLMRCGFLDLSTVMTANWPHGDYFNDRRRREAVDPINPAEVPPEDRLSINAAGLAQHICKYRVLEYMQNPERPALKDILRLKV